MKLFRYGPAGAERPGMVDPDGHYRDLSGVVEDIHGAGLTGDALKRLQAVDPSRLPRVDSGVRLGPCVAQVGNFVGIGLNYADHAKEAGLPLPEYPLAFNKAPSCIAGASDDLHLPAGARELDYEIELAVVLSRDAWQVNEAQARDCVGGYLLANDFSDRHWQMQYAGQWTIGKSAPGFGPLGPWLVTPDELPDVGSIVLELKVNGVVKQHAPVSNMIFKVPEIIAYLSQFFRLQAGDVITTGTPAGVGLATGTYLRAGDVVLADGGPLGMQEIQIVPGQA